MLRQAIVATVVTRPSLGQCSFILCAVLMLSPSPAQGKLQTVHSISVDSCAGALYVADRDAQAVRRFHIAGDFVGDSVFRTFAWRECLLV